MSRLLLLSVFAIMTVMPLSGQRLVIGERAPELKTKAWLSESPDMYGKPVMVEFFHSANSTSIHRLKVLDQLARESRGRFMVVVVTREESDKARQMLTANDPAYYPMLDDGDKTFVSYGVQYVPFAVIYDKRGRISWLGNPTTLSSADVIDMLK